MECRNLAGLLEGRIAMPYARRLCSEDDFAKLKGLAGKLPIIEIAAAPKPGAVAAEASKLRLSLRTRPRHFGRSVQKGVEVSRIER